MKIMNSKSSQTSNLPWQEGHPFVNCSSTIVPLLQVKRKSVVWNEWKHENWKACKKTKLHLPFKKYYVYSMKLDKKSLSFGEFVRKINLKLKIEKKNDSPHSTVEVLFFCICFCKCINNSAVNL